MIDKCDLYSVSSCDFGTALSMDYYMYSNECPDPLKYPELVGKGLKCSRLELNAVVKTSV